MAKKEPKIKNRPDDQANAPLALNIPKANGEPGISYPGEVIESMRYLITRIENKEPLPARMSIIAALREEGVTYLSLALAATIAHDLTSRVCYVDLNWWWPSWSPLVDPTHPGFADAIAQETALEDVIVRTGLKGLSILPAGSLPRENRPVVSRGQAINELLQKLEEHFDHLILDIPAILTTNDAVHLASLSSACCMIVRQKATSIDDVRNALDEVSHLKIFGVVMNRVSYAVPSILHKWVAAK